MGDEISQTHFDPADFARFEHEMRCELELLAQWEKTGAFSDDAPTVGIELEAWLVDRFGLPVAENELFLESLALDSVVPELAKFNFELNIQPQVIRGDGLSLMREELSSTWLQCGERANQLNHRATLIGILPTVLPEQLCLSNMTKRSRFSALNQQMHRMRHGVPIRMEIEGVERIELEHYDVMLESAATSLQVHLKCGLASAARVYNASLLASAFTVAIAANAPIVFGKRVWHDSRIAVFEQAVETGHPLHRVGFDRRYATSQVTRLFQYKVQEYPVLLPVKLQEERQKLPHLRLHNGTIWTWNRPLIGFEFDGQPHFRVEHRVMSAGPTLEDVMANIVLATGLIHGLAQSSDPIEQRLDVEVARENFYEAARHGLSAEVNWLHGTQRLSDVLRHELLPMAGEALARMHVDSLIIDHYLAIIEERIRTCQTGAVWQLKAFERFKGDVGSVMKAYLDNQATLQPVHSWT